MNYYYSVDGNAVLGPYTFEDLSMRRAQGELPPSTQVCAEGSKVWQSLESVFNEAVPGASPVPPPPPSAPPPIPVQGDATGGLIPYKNPPALVGYYLGIVGLIPFIGLPFAIAAVILGIIGLKKRRLQPVIKGAAHAWVAIICGTISVLYHGLILFGIIMASAQHHR